MKFVAGVSAFAMVAAAAQAQEAVDDAGESSHVIVVTAQKREQRLIDVPMAVAVLGGEDLERRGIDSVQDLSFAVPGLTMREDGPGSYTIFLRGLANQSGSGALVSMYLDEAPLSLSGFDQLSPVPLDFARVEVLKGPQGTLYGQGSAGGTIRFVTNDPNASRFEGKVEGEVYDVADGEVGTKLSGVLNIPLVEDQLALRVAGAYEQGGGWIDQPEAGIKNGNGTELINVRAKLLWTPGDNFSAEAMVQIHRADTKLGMGYEEPDRTVDVGPDRSKAMIPKKFDFDLYNLELRYDMGFAELVSATTYIEHSHQYPFTYIPRPGNYSYGIVEGNDDRWGNAEQFSQELRLTSAGGPFEWTLGAFYSDGNSDFIADYEYVYAPDGDLNEGGGVLYDDLYYFSESSAKSYSLFADASYKLFDRLTVGAGIRYFKDKRTSLIEYAPGAGTTQRAKFDSVDPRFYVSYQYSENGSLYANIAKGFRSGGFNSEPFAPYDPEKVYTYEIGTKGMTPGGAFSYDIAAFFTKYKDMVRRRLVVVEGQYFSESSNIGEVEVKGIELGAAVRPTAGLTFTASAAYLDSEIVATADTDQVNIPGDRTDYTPKFSITLGANYEFDWTANVPGFVRVDYSYRDKVTYIDRSSFLPSALPQASDDIGLLNARIGATFGAVGVELYGQNIANVNKAIDPYQGWANSNRTRPRVLGVKASVSF
ncbi:TonB-dependent receptor [Sphingosinicella soli]|uniref:Outer membrane receptor protein involved in Fe transport n=1 Tax=Sphingosinicella soli TaxID=333708 RepID=A0A7W7B0R0_9SPHN|nr:TonB-dependent receptor [Sphingosinicella soli]MBB4630840.1 outer membrane receptor protein involved in Fe transport [Sphingosinicella soli]